MVDIPRSAFSGSYDNDPSTSAGGGSDSDDGGTDDDVSRQRQREEFAAATGQLDELAKERAGQGGPDTDLSEIDEQDRQQAQESARQRQIAENIQSQQSPQQSAQEQAPTIEDLAEDVGQVGSVAETAADLATSGPLEVPGSDGGDQTQLQAQRDTTKLRGPFQGDDLSSPEQATNQIARTYKRAVRNPRATSRIVSGVTGAPLAQQTDAAQTAREARRAERQVRQQLNAQQTNQQATLQGPGTPTLDSPRRENISRTPIQRSQRQELSNPDFEANQAIQSDLTSGGFLSESTERDLQNISRQTQSAIQTGTRTIGLGSRVISAPARGTVAAIGGDRERAVAIFRRPANLNISTREEIGSALTQADVGTAFEEAADASTTNEVVGEQLGEGVLSTAQVANPAAFTLIGERGAEIAEGAVANAPDQPLQTAGTLGILGAEFATETASRTVEQAKNRPAFTAGQAIGGAAGSVAAGAIGQRAFLGVRSRLATRGLDFQGDVDIEDVERPEVRSGETQLTRFSEQAVPGGDRTLRTEDFPAEPATDTATELENLAREFDDPRIREALDVDEDEVTLFTARSGVKGGRFEPQSGRPYDPDAAFFAGSVSRNFLDVPDGDTGGGGLRLPDVRGGLRSLYSASRQEGTPTVVATAGEVRQFPENIVSARSDRGQMTDFLEEQANTGRFYTLRSESGSGEAEALTAAVGEGKTNPRPGAGQIESGDATEFVEVARPFRTEIRGETVPVQLFRQNEPDVTPRTTRTRSFIRGFRDDERGTLFPNQRRERSVRTLSETLDSDRSFTPGGRPGTPVVPVVPSSPINETGSSTVTSTVDGSDTVSKADESPLQGSSPVDDGGPTGSPPSDFSPTNDSVFNPPSSPPQPSIPSGAPPGGSPTSPTPSTTSSVPTVTSPTPAEDVPTQPQTPNQRGRLPDIDIDEDQRERDSVLFGARNPELVNFLDPLSGDVIETEADIAEGVDPRTEIRLR